MRRLTSVTLNGKDNYRRAEPTRYLPNDPRNLSHNMSPFFSFCLCANVHTLHYHPNGPLDCDAGGVLSLHTVRRIILDIIKVIISRRQ
jgi:hypothetical protein